MLIAKENRDAVCHTSILLFFGLGKKGLNRSTKVVELLGLDYAVGVAATCCLSWLTFVKKGVFMRENFCGRDKKKFWMSANNCGNDR